MKPGGGRGKGASFERKVCTALSLWITNGKRDDCFWRSVTSGGRAAHRVKHGKSTVGHAGDIAPTSPEGHALTNAFVIECKHVRDLNVYQAFTKRTGVLHSFWLKLCEQASDHKRAPLLIARQNTFPTMAFIYREDLARFGLLLDSVDAWVRLGGRYGGQSDPLVAVIEFEELLSRSYAAHRFSK